MNNNDNNNNKQLEIGPYGGIAGSSSPSLWIHDYF